MGITGKACSANSPLTPASTSLFVGPQGFPGIPGDRGLKGPLGRAGNAGLFGEKGDRGQYGSKGERVRAHASLRGPFITQLVFRVTTVSCRSMVKTVSPVNLVPSAHAVSQACQAAMVAR